MVVFNQDVVKEGGLYTLPIKEKALMEATTSYFAPQVRPAKCCNSISLVIVTPCSVSLMIGQSP